MLRKVLLVCGPASSLVYVAATIAGAMRWDGYSSMSQAVSELSAIDAPSRPVVVPLFLVYSALVIAFGVGLWKAAGGSRSLRVVAGLMVGYGITCLAGPFAPMHQRGVATTLTDSMHILVTIVDVVFILVIIGFAASAFGKRFRAYSIATIVVLISFGTWAAFDGPRVAANLPTPWMGLTERINIFAFLLWAAVLAIATMDPSSRRRSVCTSSEYASSSDRPERRLRPRVHG